jgi:hypothetical protein
MPSDAEKLAQAEEELNFAESAYRLKLANLIALAKSVLGRNLTDTGVKPGDKGRG